MVGVALLLAVALYQVRAVLLLVYVSALLAIGLRPIVRAVERQKVLPVGHAQVPAVARHPHAVPRRLLGSLVGLGFAVVPPLVEQGQALWTRLPDLFARGQQFLIERGLLDHELTLSEAVQKAPTGSWAPAAMPSRQWSARCSASRAGSSGS